MRSLSLLPVLALAAAALLQASAQPEPEPPSEPEPSETADQSPTEPVSDAPSADIPDTTPPGQCTIFHYVNLPPHPKQCSVTGSYTTAAGTTVYQLTCCG